MALLIPLDLDVAVHLEVAVEDQVQVEQVAKLPHHEVVAVEDLEVDLASMDGQEVLVEAVVGQLEKVLAQVPELSWHLVVALAVSTDQACTGTQSWTVC